MSRGMTPAVETAVQQEVVRRTAAVSLDFASGFVRLNGSPVDLTIDGQTYLGVGQLGGISAVEEGADLQAYRLTLTLSGIPRDAVSLALVEQYQGRAGILYDVPLDEDFRPIADPVIVFRGRMDVMEIVLGQTGEVRVTLENRLADWERPRIRRYSAEDQERAHPNDWGLRFATAMESKSIIWPNRQWFEDDARRRA